MRLRTDLVSPHEFDTIEVTLLPLDKEGSVRRRHFEAGGASYQSAQTLVELDGLNSEAYRLGVSLIDKEGTRLIERGALLDLRAALTATVPITRSCLSVKCPEDKACFGGECVDPGCILERPELCETRSQCVGDDECQLFAGCTTGVCDQGVCWADPAAPGAAQESEAPELSCGAEGVWCHPELGCTPDSAVEFVPSCDDGLWNGDETATDCGGSCPRCQGDLSTVVGESCRNGVVDAGENGVDCGGACTPCADGFDCMLQDALPVHECRALVALYAATEGEFWYDRGGWVDDENPCEWSGVTCTEGHVSDITLDDNALAGSLPSEIGNLRALESIHVHRNRISGTIPPEIGLLSELSELELFSNPVTGTIPPELGQLAALRVLSFGEHSMTGTIPPELGQLAALTSLSLNDMGLSGTIPPELGNLSDLAFVYLEENRLEGEIPSEVASLSSLSELSLSSNQLSGEIPSEFADHPNLSRLALYFDRNQLRGDIPAFVTGLEDLHLFSNACLWTTDCEVVAPYLDNRTPGYNANHGDPECSPPPNACE